VDEYPGTGKWQGPLTILQNIQAAAMVLVGWIGGVFWGLDGQEKKEVGARG